MTIRNDLSRFVKDEAGAAGVEYGILVAAIAAGIITLAFTLGDYVAGAFDVINDEMDANNVPALEDAE